MSSIFLVTLCILKFHIVYNIDMNKEFIRNRIYSIRNANNISARNLSLELGMSSEYVNQLEGGRLNPSIDFLVNFCNYFNLSLSDFFDTKTNYPTKLKELIAELNKLNDEELDLIFKFATYLNSKK